MLAALGEEEEGGFGDEFVGVKDDRRGRGLVTKDDESVLWRALLDDGVGELLGTEHGLEAGEGDVGGDEEDGGGEGDADGGGEVLAFQAQEPAEGGADEEGEGGHDGGQAEGGEGGSGEVEEVGHGEGVSAYGAVGEQGADIGDVGEVAGVPQSPGEDRGREHADDGEDGMSAREPGGGERGVAVVGSAVEIAVFLHAGEDGGDEDEQRGPDGEGVVLLIRCV